MGRGRRRDLGIVETVGTSDAKRASWRSSLGLVFLLTSIAVTGIGETLGRDSVQDAMELLSARLTTADQSPSLNWQLLAAMFMFRLPKKVLVLQGSVVRPVRLMSDIVRVFNHAPRVWRANRVNAIAGRDNAAVVHYISSQNYNAV